MTSAAQRSEARRELRALFSSGSYNEALSVAARLFERHPEDVTTAHHYALALFKAKQTAKAAGVLCAPAMEGRLPAKSFQLLGIVLRRLGRTDDAIAALDRALAVDARLTPARHERALAMYDKGDLRGTARDLKELAALRPDALWVRYNLGVVYVMMGEWDGGLAEFTACASLDPENMADYMNLGAKIGSARAYRNMSYQTHRFKNVVGILGIDLKHMTAALPDDAQAVQQLVKAVESLYGDLAVFSSSMKHDSKECDSVDLHAVIDAVLAEARPSLRVVAVTKDLDPDMPEMFCSAAELRDVLLNVVLNAAESMPGGGALHIRTASLENGFVKISFKDTGTGIPEDIRRKVFDFGFSTKRYGSGIGLSLARTIVRRFGGDIDLESVPGKGTEVTMDMPFVPETGTGLRDIAMKLSLFDDPVGLMIEEGEERLCAK